MKRFSLLLLGLLSSLLLQAQVAGSPPTKNNNSNAVTTPPGGYITGSTKPGANVPMRVNHYGPPYATKIIGNGRPLPRLAIPLTGFVDMHTHPVAQWGFGGQLFVGDNDGNPITALGSCNCYHNFVTPPFSGSCWTQNLIRNQVVKTLEPTDGSDWDGFPNFGDWPKSTSVVHQQMWWEWIVRAHRAGLNVVVALAVNSQCLANMAGCNGVTDDLRSTYLQIQKIKDLVSAHSDLMGIAYSSDDLSNLLKAGKLAVIIGTETDNIGNFYPCPQPSTGTFNPTPSEQDVQHAIDSLYSAGVRYIFPIHVTNNVFGGTAIYEDLFNIENMYNTGAYFTVADVDTTTGIKFLLQGFPFTGQNLIMSAAIEFLSSLPSSVAPYSIGMPWGVNQNYPSYIVPGPQYAMKNSQGLTPLGIKAITYMMSRGMMIDIDHMSDSAARQTLAIAQQANYPVNSGHNNLRKFASLGGSAPASENGRTEDEYRLIDSLGGMIGLGHTLSAGNFLLAYRYTLGLTRNLNVAIGTDANGFFPLPGPPPVAQEQVSYGRNFTWFNTPQAIFARYKMGNKTWDYNTDGFAHYGLFPEFLQSVKNAGMKGAEDSAFFNTAERFYEMWQKCEVMSDSLAIGPHFFTPQIGMLCPDTLTQGDRDFDGHGPQVTCSVTLSISHDSSSIVAVVNFNATETTSDWSQTKDDFTRVVYQAPANLKIDSFTTQDGLLTSAVNYLTPAAGFEISVGNAGCNDGQDIVTNSSSGPVESFQIIGDTGGDDIATYNNPTCQCSTRIQQINFHPITIFLSWKQ